MTTSIAQKILVVGGNGFIGSAVCRAALAKGMQVTSVSSSGRPYTTPKGHSPAWTSEVTWLKGSAHNPASFSGALSEADGVVHTLGTLIEDGGAYKKAIKNGDLGTIIGSVVGGIFSGGNPLQNNAEGSYEYLNRDSALRVCEAFLSTAQDRGSPSRPFVYISAEDVFRPLIPARYIETKRDAESGIEAMLSTSPDKFRGVYIRPSLVYHAHYRPLTTPAAALLDLSASIHAKLPKGLPTPSSILRTMGSGLSASSSSSTNASFGTTSLGSPLNSVANAMTIPPIHVDHVAEAIAIAVQNSDVRGVVGVRQMRKLIGWWPENDGQPSSNSVDSMA